MLKFLDVVKFWKEKKIGTVTQLEATINGKIISLA